MELLGSVNGSIFKTSRLHTQVKQNQPLPMAFRCCRGGLHVAPGALDLPVPSGLSMVYKVLQCGKSGTRGAPCLCGHTPLSTAVTISAGNSWTNNFKAKRKGEISYTSNDMPFLF